jgi:hypothetical protein
MHPQQSVEAVRAAWKLWSDETTVGTIAAAILVAIFVGWPAYRLWKASR